MCREPGGCKSRLGQQQQGGIEPISAGETQPCMAACWTNHVHSQEWDASETRRYPAHAGSGAA